jgi:hypothetical protein
VHPSPRVTKYFVWAECHVNSPPSLRRDSELARTAWGEVRYYTDAFGCRPHSMAIVRVLAHIKEAGRLLQMNGDGWWPAARRAGAPFTLWMRSLPPPRRSMA